jgi:hypothetical protein
LISGLNLRSALLPNINLIPVESAPPRKFRISVVGSSIVWTNTVWDTSIEGALEDGLNATRHNVWVQGIRMQAVTLHDTFTYLSEVTAATHAADLAVLVLNNGMLDDEGARWEAVLTDQLSATSAQLKAEGIRLVVAYHPLANDYLGPEFDRFDTRVGGEPTFRYDFSHDRVVQDVKRSGVPLIDLWPDFEAWQKAPNHRPLFGTDDKHLTVAGRELMGKLLVKDLSQFVK